MSPRSAAFDLHTIAQDVADEFPEEIKGKYGTIILLWLSFWRRVERVTDRGVSAFQ